MSVLFETKIFSPSIDHFEMIKSLLEKDQVVALPTETVYGLAGNATKTDAIKKIFAAKERPSFDPLIVHLSEKILKDSRGPLQVLIEQNIIAPEILTWPHAELIEKAMKSFWPGPLTLVLPKGLAIPKEVTSGQPTVAIRMPAHPLFQEILSRISFPLAAPSANRFGRISPTQAEHVIQELNGRIPAVLDGGACSIGVESTILKVSDKPLVLNLLRPGKIGSSEIETFFGIKIAALQIDPTVTTKSEIGQQAPGMLDQHYAPVKALILVPHSFNSKEALTFLSATLPEYTKNKPLRAGILGMSIISPAVENQLSHLDITVKEKKPLSPTQNLSMIAQSLFHSLRELDKNPNVDLIIADIPAAEKASLSQEGLLNAIYDRLNRASKNKPLSIKD